MTESSFMKKKKINRISHNTIVLLVLALAITSVEIYRYIQLEKRPTVVLKAKIEKVYFDPNTGRGYILRGQPCFDCSYSYEGQTYYSKQHFQNKELGVYKEGCYIEVVVNRDHPGVCRWNKKRGVLGYGN